MKKFLINLVRLYQRTRTHLHGLCKFYPTCSDYMIDSINEYGSFIGTLKGIKRILRCNPFSKGGYDPVPKRKENIK